MRPRPRASRPDVGADRHVAGVVERAGAHRDHRRVALALAVDRRAAVGAEKAVQRTSAVRFRRVALRRALRDLESIACQRHVDAAAGAGSLLAMRAVAGAQLRHRRIDGVADRAAEAAAGERGGHKFIPFRLFAAGTLAPTWCRLVFYDVNANSNLRPSVAQAFGFDPFERVVDYLVREIRRTARPVPRTAAL